jgi:Arc/MetJ-type ribon-helix-helix transcriptional regulator
MSTFDKPRERLTVLVNVNMSKSQVEALDRIVTTLGYRGRSDVLRAALDCYLKHTPAARKAAANTTPDPSAGSEGPVNEGADHDHSS